MIFDNWRQHLLQSQGIDGVNRFSIRNWKSAGRLESCSIIADQLSCSFDNDQFCAWKHDDIGEFQWTLNQGPTESFNTGPAFDHTTGSMIT